MPRLSPPPSPPPQHNTATTTLRAPLQDTSAPFTATVPAPSAPPPPPPPRTPPPPADPELERVWSSVRESLSKVLNGMLQRHAVVRTEPQEWARVYSAVANLFYENDEVRKRRAYGYVRDFVREPVRAQLRVLEKLQGEALLVEYVSVWKALMQFVSFMKRVLYYSQKFWIRDHANTLKDDPVRPLDKLLMFYWREDLLSKLPAVVDTTIAFIHKERRGMAVDTVVVKGVIDTLVEVGGADIPVPDPDDDMPSDAQGAHSLDSLHLYIRVFEEDFLALTRSFYKAEGLKIVAEGDVTAFMTGVLVRLEEEAERGRRLLHPNSGSRLRQVVEEELIGNHTDFLQKAAREMIKKGRENDLRLVYQLLRRVDNGLAPLRALYVSYVRQEGNAMVVRHVDQLDGKDDMKSNLSLVRVLVRLHRTFANLVRRCFEGSPVVMMAIDDAFRGFANRSLGAVSLPNLLAHYVDQFLLLRNYDRDMWDIDRDGEGQVGAPGTEIEGRDDTRRSNDPDAVKRVLEEISELERQSMRSKRMRTESGSQDTGGNAQVISRSGTNARSEDGLISDYISELVRLFMYLEDKDMFFETHRRLFAKRLLGQHDEDRERLFINKVKVQMGATYIQRLNGMLKDKITSNEMRSKFQLYLEEKREVLRLHASERPTADIGSCEVVAADQTQRANVLETNGSTSVKTTRRKTRAGDESPRELGVFDPVGSSLPLSVAASNEDQSAQSSDSCIANDGDSYPAPSGGLAKDKDASETVEESFDLSNADMTAALRIDFNAHVLNALHWPAVKVPNLRIPPVLQACQRLFTKFYMRDKQTRKLSWVPSLSTVHLAATFGGQQYTFVVSAFQACILMRLNYRDHISVGEACKELNVPREDLCQHILPLLITKRGRLLKLMKTGWKARELREATSIASSGNENQIGVDGSGGPQPFVAAASEQPRYIQTEPSDVEDRQTLPNVFKAQRDGNRTVPVAGKESSKRDFVSLPNLSSIKDDDVIHINLKYVSRLHRVVVPTTVAKLASAESAASKRNVVVDRNTQMDATLVRIMKASKEITYVELSSRAIAELTPLFLPDPRLIKTRLERLIDQDYVERDPDDARLYRYSA